MKETVTLNAKEQKRLMVLNKAGERWMGAGGVAGVLGVLSSGDGAASLLVEARRGDVAQNSEPDRSAVARLMMVPCVELMTLQKAQAA